MTEEIPRGQFSIDCVTVGTSHQLTANFAVQTSVLAFAQKLLFFDEGYRRASFICRRKKP